MQLKLSFVYIKFSTTTKRGRRGPEVQSGKVYALDSKRAHPLSISIFLISSYGGSECHFIRKRLKEVSIDLRLFDFERTQKIFLFFFECWTCFLYKSWTKLTVFNFYQKLIVYIRIPKYMIYLINLFLLRIVQVNTIVGH